METVVDPVCGVQIDKDSAAATATHEGQTYYFCSEACRERFAVDPARHVGT